MATFNGGRMVALFLCMLFAPNVSFAQQQQYRTYVLYMEDPVVEQRHSEVDKYEQRWNDPLTWSDFDAHFTPARQAQIRQINDENDFREAAASTLLSRPPNPTIGVGIEAWVPSPFPLKRFTEDNGADSLFSTIVDPNLPSHLRGVEGQTLREVIEADGWEPDPDSNGLRDCRRGPRCAQAKKLFTFITGLIDKHDNRTARIISFRFKALTDTTIIEDEFVSYVDELETGDGSGDNSSTTVGLAPVSVELLRPAAMGTDEWRIDVPPYDQYPPYLSIAHTDTTKATPVGKPVSSNETSSWGRIKATFAD